MDMCRALMVITVTKIPPPLIIRLVLAVCAASLFLLLPNAGDARPGGGHSYSRSSESTSSQRSVPKGSLEKVDYYKEGSLTTSYGSSKHRHSRYSSGSTAVSQEETNRMLTTGGIVLGVIVLCLVTYMVGTYIYHRLTTTKEEQTTEIIVTRTSFASMFPSGQQTVLDKDDLIEWFTRLHDKNFSRVLFLDFVCLLYVKFYDNYGKPGFSNIYPFINDSCRFDNNVVTVNDRVYSEIIVGAAFINTLATNSESATFTVEIDSNFTVASGGKRTRYDVTERWQLTRNLTVVSPKPAKSDQLTCPACGAPTDFTDSGQCSYCRTFVVAGTRQWALKDRVIVRQEPVTMQSVIAYAPESGTSLPTIYQKMIAYNADTFAKRHNVDWKSYSAGFHSQIVSPLFLELYTAWSEMRLHTVRHLLSDRLYEAHDFWQKAYRKAKLTNRLEKITIGKIEDARIDLDAFYESVTVRISATCLDYFIDAEGRIVAGSNTKLRAFSEYWTFICRRGIIPEKLSLNKCPNCGAPSDKMGQAAICEYCNTKVTTGEFSWVLSMIVQDEVFRA